MFLAIDIGNSQTSIGVFKKSELIQHFRITTVPSRTADEYAALWYPLLHQHELGAERCDGVALASVVPAADFSIDSFCRQYLSHTPFRIHSQLHPSVRINVKVPSEVGADRIANVAYAVKYLGLPSVVVDFGTATTFDVVSKEGAYEGGIIIPGVRMSIEALGAKTSKLSNVDIVFPSSVIGKTTVECIQAGVLHGYSEMVSGLLGRVEAEMGSLSSIALTGGLSFLFQDRLKFPVKVLPNLTLEGILALYSQARS